ncbi:Cyclin-dependent kinase inhibitor 1 [Acipenser ruthenus]|uniref:Cyclin-dependent kinase inhibitor 1 n=1 Tax=Acipenser ruthenus TaxID=7906 RepID=A0A444USX5_ACIRT|nr:Cyclin-dependent kinase inhibitor 1 [Acipenser ruthenus]RXM91272.1 Cyclin-dependent kinase inhibitor 1 [Acipenser ruthenus]
MAPQNGILTPSFNTPVCRSLFGPVDREQLRVEFQESMRKTLEEATCKWSFDFVNESPLQGGDFQWEGVPGNKVPVLYRPCMISTRRRGGGCNQPGSWISEVGVELTALTLRSHKHFALTIPALKNSWTLHIAGLRKTRCTKLLQ